MSTEIMLVLFGRHPL